MILELELNDIKEIEVLKEIINLANKSVGIQGAETCLYFFKRIQQAEEKLKLETKEIKEEAKAL